MDDKITLAEVYEFVNNALFGLADELCHEYVEDICREHHPDCPKEIICIDEECRNCMINTFGSIPFEK